MPFLGRSVSHFKLSGSIPHFYGHKNKQEIELSLCCDHMQQKSLLFLKVMEKKGTLSTKWIVPPIARYWLGRDFLCFQPKQRMSSRAAHPEPKFTEARPDSLPCWLHGKGPIISTWYFLTQLKYYGFYTCMVLDIRNPKLLQSSYASM